MGFVFLFPVRQFINRLPKVVVNDISFIDFKVDHQVEALSWLHCLGCPVEIISLSIELVSLSARVTSIKSATTSLSELVRDRDRDP